MNPWPVAHTLLNGQRFKVYEAELCEGNGNPGEVIALTKKSWWSLQEKGRCPSKLCSRQENPKCPSQTF